MKKEAIKSSAQLKNSGSLLEHCKTSTKKTSSSRESDVVKKIVNAIWNDVDSQLRINHSDCLKSNAIRTNKSQVVRIFVSSTFSDFFEEREILVKEVCYCFLKKNQTALI